MTLGILFSKAVTTILVGKLVMLGILSLKSFILALRGEGVVKLVMLDISPLTLFILALSIVIIYFSIST